MSLKARLAAGEVLLAPGIYDPLTALIATQHGFKALYVSGASIAYTRLGRSDIGLTSMTEIAETVALIRDRVDTPLIVDADNGHGNALNVQRTVRLYERAGANALQLEDQSLPKRCGHLGGKSLVSCGEMVGKIKAAVDARTSDETLIIARTDAIAVEGFDSAIERAERFAEAGAAVLFVEAPRTREQLEVISARLARACRCWPIWSRVATHPCTTRISWARWAFASSFSRAVLFARSPRRPRITTARSNSTNRTRPSSRRCTTSMV